MAAHLVVGEDGSVENVDIVSENPLLGGAASKAGKAWTFKPFKGADGKPSKVAVRVISISGRSVLPSELRRAAWNSPGAAATDAANMLSAERGLLHLAQLQTFTQSAERRDANSTMSSAVAAWLPADEEMWQLCGKQVYQGAFKVFDEKVTPQTDGVQEAARQVLDLEHRALQQTKNRSVQVPVRSRWTAIGLLLVSVLVGVIGI